MKRMNWIKVEDQPPSIGAKVLVTDGKSIDIGIYNNGFYDQISPFYGKMKCVKYWMPLPGLPKNEVD